MLESYYHIEEINDGIETSSIGCSRSLDSLSSLESAYLDEVKDYPDAYASRLKELGISDNIEIHDFCCRNGKFDNSNDTYSVDCTSNKLEEGIDYESGTPLNSDRGQWDGDRGNSSFVFNPEAKPSSKNYGNLKDQTYAEMGKELGDSSPRVSFVKGNPVFDRDSGTYTGRPLEIKLDEGIGKYLSHDELLNGGKINREYLHTEAFNRMAEKYGVSVEELKVFKGDSAPVEALSKKWNCSEAEVWERCGNPNQIQRVLHEDKDQITIQLVPRMYHDNVTHSGGVEEASKAAREGK